MAMFVMYKIALENDIERSKRKLRARSALRASPRGLLGGYMSHHVKFNPSDKARYWWALMYPENMVDNWEEDISSILQKPFAYCIHNQDGCYTDGSPRKVHVHIICAWSGPTTGATALKLFKKLEKPGCLAVCNNEIEYISDISWAYNYLIHDTITAKKKGKKQYDPSERIVGNNFDIGNYEQISKTDTNMFLDSLTSYILDERVTNFAQFYRSVKNDQRWEGVRSQVLEIVERKSGFLERIIKGVYLESRAEIQEMKDSIFFQQITENRKLSNPPLRQKGS